MDGREGVKGCVVNDLDNKKQTLKDLLKRRKMRKMRMI
jgi:hypothetical protein